ncbi:MAG: pyruvate formate lyase-activating protein [Clostridiales bacterium]|nr:pyruvate formate lyase-activating protein [Clostridiales bacterium]
MVKGKLHSIETFGSVDGPGIRTVFFMQGCPARCLYCHNPDSWKMSDGRETDIDELLHRAKRGMPYYGNNGGVTFSGGEPMLQGEFLIEAMKRFKEVGINTAIDTSGTYYDKNTRGVIEQADLLLLDIKHTDSEKFTELTACKQDPLFKVIEDIKEFNKPIWIRQVIVPGINDSKEYIESLNEFIKDFKTVENIELLGYHKMAIDKYKKLGMEYKLDGVPEMGKEVMEELRALVRFPGKEMKKAC